MQIILKGRGPRSDGFPWYNNDSIIMAWLPLALARLQYCVGAPFSQFWDVAVTRARSLAAYSPRFSYSSDNITPSLSGSRGFLRYYQKEVMIPSRSLILVTSTINFSAPVQVKRVEMRDDGPVVQTFATASVAVGLYEEINAAQSATTTANTSFFVALISLHG